MLSSYFWQAQSIFAVCALSVDMRFPIPPLLPLQAEKLPDFTPDATERLVLASPLVKIARHHAEGGIDQRTEGKKRQDCGIDKGIDYRQNKCCHDEKIIQGVYAVSAAHELDQPLAERDAGTVASMIHGFVPPLVENDTSIINSFLNRI